MAARRHRRAARLHRGVQQHRQFEARLRMGVRLAARTRRPVADDPSRPSRAVQQFRSVRESPASHEHAADRCSADRVRRGARRDIPLAATEIEQFRREKQEREGAAAGAISDSEFLREVMNTVGQKGRLGEPIRCVVSVSMLTEGWDANTVTHILCVRAFGTQLLCEQVIGRGLRRQSYELNPKPSYSRRSMPTSSAFPSTSPPSHRRSRRGRPKGLEFRAVLVVACDEGVLPLAARVADVADEFELDEIVATERKLLYVAATRARDRLFISGVAPGAEFLEDLPRDLSRLTRPPGKIQDPVSAAIDRRSP